MIQIRRSGERGHADHGWLDSRHTFSFADYHDPAWMGFRSLRVINDDRVAAGRGFGTHPHRDMEIVSYVLGGSLEHRDSMGNGRIIQPGEFQHMSAGTGVLHSEFNPSTEAPTHFLQIWIVPDQKGVPPRYAEKSCRDAASGRLHLVASRTGRADSIAIRQDADLWLAKLDTGERVRHTLAPDRHAWIHVATGSLTLNGQPLEAGDSAGITGESSLELAGTTPAQAILFDLR
jgi:redox-sensitive bicupin YhaK (pirin superfamily)